MKEKKSQLRKWIPAMLLCVGSVFLSSCAKEHALLIPAPKVTKDEVAEISKIYTEMECTATKSNAFHGMDPDGKMIQTPDLCSEVNQEPGFWWMTEGMVNVGMPYKWGGWDTPKTFRDKLTQDPVGRMAKYAAGDIATLEKKRRGDEAVSRYAAGIDCSGFVSRCWRLDRPYSTRELAQLCTKIPMKDLRCGDILLKKGEHVALFLGWQDAEQTKMLISEAGARTFWGVAEHVVPSEGFTENNYECYRYNNLH